MPAIQPALLRQQAILLAESFAEPKAFVRSLHHLLEFYSDRSRRPGQTGIPAPLLPSYHVRPPVIRQVLLELEAPARESPQEALKLCDALWGVPYLEFRLLAISLLGKISLQPSGLVIERLNAWILSNPERRLVQAILEDGCKILRTQQPGEYFKMIEEWLNHPRVYFQQVGLQALLPQVRDPRFDNLPVIFRLIQPYILTIKPALREDIVDLMQALARRSPRETAFFLRQNLSHPDQKDVPFLIRQCASEFPEDIRRNLLNAISGSNLMIR